MRRRDAQALLGLLGCCCECECPDEQSDNPPRRPAPRRRDGQAGDAVPSMPVLKRSVPLDEPIVTPPASFATPQRPGDWATQVKALPRIMHVPDTDAERLGIFIGEKGVSPQEMNFVVLDNGQEVQAPSNFMIDHQRRVVSSRKSRMVYAADTVPPRVQLEYTAARRSTRDPAYLFIREDGTREMQTRWSYNEGSEIDVGQGDMEKNFQYFTEEEVYFDGRTITAEVGHALQNVDTYDFDWNVKVAGQPGTVERRPTASAVTVKDVTVSAAYRTQIITRVDLKGDEYRDTIIQAHVENIWFPRDVKVGQEDAEYARYYEVTAVLEREYAAGSTSVLRARANAWVVIAQLNEHTSSGPPPDPEKPPGTPEYGEILVNTDGGSLVGWGVVGYIKRDTVAASLRLRDRIGQAWSDPPAISPVRFTSADGKVQVEGPRIITPHELNSAPPNPVGVLKAFGQTFQGGSWAALRDNPRRRPDGSWDFTPLIVLHLAQNTLTVIRSDGKQESCSLAQFEKEILRVPEGSFVGFSPVGFASHSWPPQWAWCRLKTETRAIAAHDAWRDSYKRLPALPNPPRHWEWTGRPGKRPRELPGTAPRPPLGLTLADVTGDVWRDELLKLNEGPVWLPVTAASDGRDVRATVAKRPLYQPAQWPEELDDRTSTGSPLQLTFDQLPAPSSGTRIEAVLVIRYRGQDTAISVNGTSTPLRKLGHNANIKGGWHEYALIVPPSSSYTLTFAGRVSRAVLCVRVTTIPTGGIDS